MISLNPAKTGLAVGITASILSLVCAILVTLLPTTTLTLMNAIFHGIDLAQIQKVVSWESIALGIVEIFIIGSVAGGLFSLVYNALNRE